MQQCNINDPRRLPISTDPRDLIDVRGEGDVTVTKTFESDRVVFTVKYQEYKAPSIIINSAIHKVGTTISSFVFTGQIIPGTADIISRSIIPNRNINLEQVFSWTESNILGTSAGIWPRFNGNPLKIVVTDSTNNSIEQEVGISFRNLFYMGYSVNDIVTELEIKSFSNAHLLSNIRERYNSFSYNFSIVPAYVYWVFPAGTPTFTEASEGPLPVPLKLDHPNIHITDEGITIPYRVIRTAVRTRFNNSIINLR